MNLILINKLQGDACLVTKNTIKYILILYNIITKVCDYISKHYRPKEFTELLFLHKFQLLTQKVI